MCVCVCVRICVSYWWWWFQVKYKSFLFFVCSSSLPVSLSLSLSVVFLPNNFVVANWGRNARQTRKTSTTLPPRWWALEFEQHYCSVVVDNGAEALTHSTHFFNGTQPIQQKKNTHTTRNELFLSAPPRLSSHTFQTNNEKQCDDDRNGETRTVKMFLDLMIWIDQNLMNGKSGNCVWKKIYSRVTSTRGREENNKLNLYRSMAQLLKARRRKTCGFWWCICLYFGTLAEQVKWVK